MCICYILLVNIYKGFPSKKVDSVSSGPESDTPLGKNNLKRRSDGGSRLFT